jgi:YggT family protein
VDAVTGIACLLLGVWSLILLIRVILSWIVLAGWRPPVTGPGRSAYDLLFSVTEPVLRPLRRIVPPVGMFDLSVAVAFVVILVLRAALCGNRGYL